MKQYIKGNNNYFRVNCKLYLTIFFSEKVEKEVDVLTCRGNVFQMFDQNKKMNV